MKARTAAAAAAALAATGAYAQAGYELAPVSYTTIYYPDCPEQTMETMITITEGVTATTCSECPDMTRPPMHTTVYTTVYDSLCPTGTVPHTYTITESCADEPTPTCGHPGETHVPPGFTVTEKTCTVGCEKDDMPVTITEPCDCEATEGTSMGSRPTDASPTGPADGEGDAPGPAPTGGVGGDAPAPTGGAGGDAPAPTGGAGGDAPAPAPGAGGDDGDRSPAPTGQPGDAPAPADPAAPARPVCTKEPCPEPAAPVEGDKPGDAPADAAKPPMDDSPADAAQPPAYDAPADAITPPVGENTADRVKPDDAADPAMPPKGDDAADAAKPPYPTADADGKPAAPAPSEGMPGDKHDEGMDMDPKPYDGAGTSLTSFGLVSSAVMAIVVAALTFAL